MADSRYQPNPLRPYYVPATIGPETTPIPSATPRNVSTSGPTFSFPDLDYSDYIPEGSPSALGNLRGLFDQALWRYVNTVLAQPFEVAKLILQTRVAQEEDVDDVFRGPEGTRHSEDVEVTEENEDEDEPNYFSSSAPLDHYATRSPTRGRRGRPVKRDSYQRSQQISPDRLVLRDPHSLLDTLSALSSNGGAFAIWKGTNSTFVYQILLRTLDTFLRSFLATAVGLPEADVPLSGTPSISDSSILASPTPLATVLIATAATALSALLLSPIDAARTRLILTPASQEPRSLLSTMRTLTPSWLIRSHLVPITFFSASIPQLISTSTPLFLRTYLGLDPAMNPASWSVATFFASALDLSLKFPLETVLRRAQIATWTSPAFSPPRTSQSQRKAIKTVVPVPQSYRGILPTIWNVVREEGYSESAADRTAALMGKTPRRKRKGQGVAGLYRGWRVGLWGLVGVWGTGFVSGLQNGAEPAATGPHGGKF